MALCKSKASDLHGSITRAAAADDLKKTAIASTELSIILVKITDTLEFIISKSSDKNSERSSSIDNTEYYEELLKNLQKHYKHAKLKIKIAKKQFLLTITLDHASSLTFTLNMLITMRCEISAF